MATYSTRDAAERAGVSPELLARMVELELLPQRSPGDFSEGDVRKIGLLGDFVEGGLPLEGLAAQIKAGRLTVSFMDSPGFDMRGGFSNVTFEQLSESTGIPVQTLMVIREAAGSSIPAPDAIVRENEMALVPYVQALLESDYPVEAIERGLRSMGEGLRRFAIAEVDKFNSFVIRPVAMAPDATGQDIAAAGTKALERIAPAREVAMIAAFRGHLSSAITVGIMEGFAGSLEAAGLLESIDRPPAMCFLDITGYTRLTVERGDRAAAALAQDLGTLVQRTAHKHGGRPVKWLGDGVMLWFRDPGPAVVAALEMAAGVADAGLPPAHVGLHAGPVVMQDGDYYGQTVNLASRIAGYARAGEVVVSQTVVDAAAGSAVEFSDLGDVELKGVSTQVRLYAAYTATGARST